MPSAQKSTGFSGVAIPRKVIVAPTIYNTLGIPKSCFTSMDPKSASLDAFVTRIPVASEIKRDGTWLTSPSPMVNIPYF